MPGTMPRKPLKHRYVFPTAHKEQLVNLIDQANISQRIKFICDRRYEGKRDEMARAASITHSVLRDVFRGKIVNNDAFEHVVKRVCLLRGINGTWVRKGEGHPFLNPGDTTEPLPTPPPEPKPLPPAPPAPQVTPAPPASSQLDLFAGLVARLAECERNASASRATSSAAEFKADEALAKAEAAAAKAEQPQLEAMLTQQYKRACEDLTGKLGPIKKLLAEISQQVGELERRAGRFEAAAIEIRRDLDNTIEMVTAVREEPSEEAPAFTPEPTDHEAMLSPEFQITSRDYLATEGRLPLLFRQCGMTARNLSQYMPLVESIMGVEPQVGTHEHNDSLRRYRVSAFRLLAEYMDSINWHSGTAATRGLVMFIAPRVNGLKLNVVSAN